MRSHSKVVDWNRKWYLIHTPAIHSMNDVSMQSSRLFHLGITGFPQLNSRMQLRAPFEHGPMDRQDNLAKCEIKTNIWSLVKIKESTTIILTQANFTRHISKE